ncbi:MAG: GEVED domain-containing protein, partial [Bacteroidota bacterium]
MALTQNFAFGTNRLTIAVANSNVTLGGENTTHTGESGSYGTGADVLFTTTTSSARTITLTFDVEVSTFKMSIYDLDGSQRVTVSAKDAANAAKTVTLSKPSGGTVVLASNPGNSPTGTGNSTGYGNNASTGTLNIDIAGPVKTITFSFNNAAGDFWLSDMSACITASFPTSYYLISKPFAGQPGYVLTAVDNDFYYTNTANGVSKFLFTEPGNAYVNSVGYDPYNRFVYYTYSLTGSPGTDKALKKYDVNTKTISTVLADITTLGIPVFDYGIESGSAGFYNGSLFLGIEGYNSAFDKGRKAMVWRIDFNGSLVPYRASQVYSSLADDGSGTIKHDWSDIGMSNGILYDFDGANGDEDFYVYNMQTGALTNYTPAAGIVGRQIAVGWDEKLYNVETGTITQYNGTNGHTGATHTITSTPAIPGGGSWGDAGEAFRPFVDYGDAPATYDPVTGDPAVHDSSGTTLRIGAAFNTEGAKRGVTSAEDPYDDGVSTVPFLPSGAGNYLAQVSVFNNTGANATLTAWLDYNGNGVFNTGEGITQTVGSSASAQLKYLYWPSITVPMANGSVTYLRIRITSTANGMTTANPTGYFANGEVED